MYWLDLFKVKRYANVSNTFIIETSDFKRIDQFIRYSLEFELKPSIINTVRERLGIEMRHPDVVVVNLQRGSMEEYDRQRGKFVVSQQAIVGGVNLPRIYERLRSKPTFVIIRYVYSKRHADLLSDFVVDVSQDTDLFMFSSTVIIFTFSASLFDQAVLKVAFSIDVEPSYAEERRMLLESIASEWASLRRARGLDADVQQITEELINASAGLTLHEVEVAAAESLYTRGRIDASVFTEYKIKILRDMGLQYIEPRRGFESVGGYGYLKRYIIGRVVMPLKEPERAGRYGISIPRGIILYGPPGTGKSWFAKALARELGLPMVSLSPADFLRGIVGETEARVRQIARIIESMAPVVVFIDEIDQLALRRDSVKITDSGVSRRMTNMILEWLGSEDRKSFVVGATNHIESIDPAFLRPGRIDEVIPVFYPDFEARKEIIKIHTEVARKIPLAKDVSIDALASATYLWTGAEIEKMILEAARQAFIEKSEEVHAKHFEAAIKTMKIEREQRLRKIEEMKTIMQTLEIVNQALLEEAIAAIESETPTPTTRLI
jgi:ATP-dependent 26S proteasome regulatory subunit